VLNSLTLIQQPGAMPIVAGVPAGAASRPGNPARTDHKGENQC